MKQKLQKAAVYLVLAMHFFGLVGMSQVETREWFLALTPLNLLISGVFIILFQEQPTRTFYFYFLCATVIGYSIEVIGVHTGTVFGQYWYGNTLGFKLFAVPLLIGLNWATLICATGTVVENHFTNTVWWVKAVLSALLMVSLDSFIEPVAIQLDFWHWANEIIPLQNFVAWFFIALGLQLLQFYLPFSKSNPLAKWLLISQFFFFIGHYFINLL